MPLEDPRLPTQTYESMLRQGESSNMGLLAGEVAFIGKGRKSSYLWAAAVIVSMILWFLFIRAVQS